MWYNSLNGRYHYSRPARRPMKQTMCVAVMLSPTILPTYCTTIMPTTTPQDTPTASQTKLLTQSLINLPTTLPTLAPPNNTTKLSTVLPMLTPDTSQMISISVMDLRNQSPWSIKENDEEIHHLDQFIDLWDWSYILLPVINCIDQSTSVVCQSMQKWSRKSLC